MCWKSKNKPELKIADEDISVFKIIRRHKETLYSYYKNFKYKVGVLYKERIGMPSKEALNCIYNINEGFHSYSSKECWVETIFKNETLYSNIYTKHGNPIYTLDTCYMDCDVSSFYNVIANCIIPKGSKYYLNNKGEYVSDHIKIVECEDLKVAIYMKNNHCIG